MAKEQFEEQLEERTIIITGDDGIEREGFILFSFEANGDEFVLYELEDNAYAAKVDDNGDLAPIEEDEWKLVEKIYNEYMEDEGEEVEEDE